MLGVLRLLVVLAFFIALPRAQAGLSQCNSYFVPSGDGSRLFVMRPMWEGKPFGRDQRDGPYILPDGRSVDVASTFPMSGLYDVETLKPLWTWDAYALEENFAISSDLSSFAVVVPQALEPNATALYFFHEGKETDRYRAHDLVKAFRSRTHLETSLTDGVHLVWLGSLKASGQSLRLTTASRRYVPGYRESYRFDFASGRMTEARVPSLWLVFGAPILLFAALMIWLMVKVLRRRPPPAPEPESSP